ESPVAIPQQSASIRADPQRAIRIGNQREDVRLMDSVSRTVEAEPSIPVADEPLPIAPDPDRPVIGLHHRLHIRLDPRRIDARMVERLPIERRNAVIGADPEQPIARYE